MADAAAPLRIVIAGGGTAGWMAAAAFTKLLPNNVEVSLVESEEIGTVGVGESTIPPLQVFHKLIGIDEVEFVKAVTGTFKLGINFEDWGDRGEEYFHSFGQTGKGCWAGEFQHFWLRGREQGLASDFGDYCLELRAARAGRFTLSEQLKLNHAYHIDATKYAQLLRRHSETNGVRRIEGKIIQVDMNSGNGNIASLTLASGQQVEGDFFVDCTGFRGLLIEKALGIGFEDWSDMLPNDRAAVVQTQRVGPALPYTRAIAHEAGWQWRIPLQSREGNGVVYCSRYMSDEEAVNKLLSNIEGETINEPRVLKFVAGRRKKGWNKNCVALGLASGFVEPLESTSIHLVMSGIIRLLRLFPLREISQAAIDEYNSQSKLEIERIRDFIMLHYHATQRDDSPFWDYCRKMELPDELAQRVQLFKDTGCLFKAEDELFRVDSWCQVMIGQGITPKEYNPIAAIMSNEELGRFLETIQSSIDEAVLRLPSHQDFLEQHCRSAPS